MRKSFLEYVAEDIIGKHGTNLSRVAIVFPNKRAALFMNEYLAQRAHRPMWSPAYITISELFQKHSPLTLGDPIKLICDLHKVYVETTGKDETLDQFYGWGQILLADFDDIDKNMADPRKVFANLNDLHEFDDLSYLSPEQRELLARFFSNFAEQHPSALKQNFLSFWSHLYDIYCRYHQRLSQQGLAYEGALYRSVAEKAEETESFAYETYCFVGFNMLQKAEQMLFAHLQKQGRARFYWDYDQYFMTPQNESGHFIRQYLPSFPNELSDDAHLGIFRQFEVPKDISYISAPTEHAQASYVSQWLQENNRIAAGRNTAIVLCDESLLPSVINALPPGVDKVNITTGYPLSQSPAASLLSALISLQTEGISASGKYRIRHVLKVLRHPFAMHISPIAGELAARLIDNKIHSLRPHQLGVDAGTELLFRDLHTSSTHTHITQCLISWLCELYQHIGVNARKNDDAFFQESLFRTYTLLNRLRELMESGDLVCTTTTLQRLLTQMVQATSIPFHGEPAEGLQIMGVLETRNLDFDHLLVLSCNEGKMPKGVGSASFIPYSLRKAYGLTTSDHQVAIFSYYFHSLLQRATDITLTFNNATDNGQRGEMSRFMLQLMIESPHPISHNNLLAGQASRSASRLPVDKDRPIEEQLQALQTLSPTAISRYLRCPKIFYYCHIARIAEPDHTEVDDVDSRNFGNIFHRAAQLVYQHVGHNVTKAAIDAFLDSPHKLEEIVDQAFSEEIFRSSLPNARHEYNGLQIIIRQVIIDYLKQLLAIDCKLTPFTIVSVEHPISFDVSIQNDNHQSVTIKGIIDRIDRVTDPATGKRYIRVIDYKTSNHTPKGVKDIDEIFDPALVTQKHTDYYLQTMLYAHVVRHNRQLNPENLPVKPALLFIQHATASDYDPTLIVNRQPVSDIGSLDTEFIQHLTALLTEIADTSISFAPTTDRHRCETCPYQFLCRSWNEN